jgi:nucleotide-binding universal stress UspA family protein
MFRTILLPLDGSRLAEESIPYAESLTRQYNADLVLGWVIQLRTTAASEFDPLPHGIATLFDTTIDRERAQTYLNAIKERLAGRGLRVSLRIAEGYSIADTIVAMSKEIKADLIVKTTYARLGLSRWLHGNVAAEVLQRAPCPLFLVRVTDA